MFEAAAGRAPSDRVRPALLARMLWRHTPRRVWARRQATTNFENLEKQHDKHAGTLFRPQAFTGAFVMSADICLCEPRR